LVTGSSDYVWEKVIELLVKRDNVLGMDLLPVESAAFVGDIASEFICQEIQKGMGMAQIINLTVAGLILEQ
jgi:hypothetical protein